jgi:hypothetical protein
MQKDSSHPMPARAYAWPYAMDDGGVQGGKMTFWRGVFFAWAVASAAWIGFEIGQQTATCSFAIPSNTCPLLPGVDPDLIGNLTDNILLGAIFGAIPALGVGAILGIAWLFVIAMRRWRVS